MTLSHTVNSSIEPSTNSSDCDKRYIQCIRSWPTDLTHRYYTIQCIRSWPTDLTHRYYTIQCIWPTDLTHRYYTIQCIWPTDLTHRYYTIQCIWPTDLTHRYYNQHDGEHRKRNVRRGGGGRAREGDGGGGGGVCYGKGRTTWTKRDDLPSSLLAWGRHGGRWGWVVVVGQHGVEG